MLKAGCEFPRLSHARALPPTPNLDLLGAPDRPGATRCLAENHSHLELDPVRGPLQFGRGHRPGGPAPKPPTLEWGPRPGPLPFGGGPSPGGPDRNPGPPSPFRARTFPLPMNPSAPVTRQRSTLGIIANKHARLGAGTYAIEVRARRFR